MNVAVVFTGTRRGMTEAQVQRVEARIAHFGAGAHRFEMHNGCAEGADDQALDILARVQPNVDTLHLWPVLETQRRRGHHYMAALASMGVHYHGTETSPLKRDRAMVDWVAGMTSRPIGVVLAAPFESREHMTGGTWATVAYGRVRTLRIETVWPDGTLRVEESPE